MKFFNNLTPAELERLACLVEETGEALQAIGKILRHGYESAHPSRTITNRRELEHELGDVRHAMIALCNSGDLSKQCIHDRANLKSIISQRWMHHQEELEE